MTPEFVDPDTDRIGEQTTVPRCPHCGRPFDTERSRALHVGEDHGDEWSDDEASAYEEAVAAEEAELWAYHVKVVIGLSTFYTVIVLAYMVVFG